MVHLKHNTVNHIYVKKIFWRQSALLFLFYFFNVYNAVFVSTVQQCKSAIIIHISLPLVYPPPHLSPIPSSRSSQSARLDSMRHIVTSHQLFIHVLHTTVYICWSDFLHSSCSFLPPQCPQAPSLRLSPFLPCR